MYENDGRVEFMSFQDSLLPRLMDEVRMKDEGKNDK